VREIVNERGNTPAASTSTDDARIIAATVGEPRILNGPIEIVPYDPEWPLHYDRFASEIRGVLGERVRGLEHVGSTSVPGLSAKPIIDIVLVVQNSADEAGYVPALATAGYVLRIREPEWYEHRVLGTGDLSANVHVFSEGCPEIERMVRFRDWLRNQAADRELYEQTKRRLASRTWKYVQNYADAKGEVVQAIIARANARAGDDSHSP